jgi:hypothetical protein
VLALPGAEAARHGPPVLRACEHFGTTVPEQTRAAMVRLYLDEQVSIHEIARRTHWAVACVHRALKIEGVQMRPVGVVLHQPKVLPLAVIDRTVELYLSGLSEARSPSRWACRSRASSTGSRRPASSGGSVGEGNRIGTAAGARARRPRRVDGEPGRRAAGRGGSDAAPLLTGEIALRLRVTPELARSYLDGLRAFGLVSAKRVRVGRALPTGGRVRTWRSSTCCARRSGRAC